MPWYNNAMIKKVLQKNWRVKIFAVMLLATFVFSLMPTNSYAAYYGGGGTTYPPPTTASTPITEASASEQFAECGWGGGAHSFLGCIQQGLTWVAVITMWVWSQILAIAAVLFAYAIKISVLDLKLLISTMPGIKVGWAIIRDLCNIFFIFVLLYIAIGTILQLKEVNVKQMVPKVIMVALLINFSFAITGVVIDAGNQLALFFYQGLPDNLSVSVVKNLKVQELLITPSKDGAAMLPTSVTNIGTNSLQWNQLGNVKDSITTWGVFFAMLGAIVIFAVTAFVLGAGAILFIIRTVYLICLLLLSPFGFFFQMIPGKSSVSSKFWSTLISQVFFAPAFLVMFYIVFRIMEKGSEFFKNPVGTPASLPYIGMLMYFIIIIGLLIACLKIANSMGAIGASTAMAVGKKWQGQATSFMGRNTAGRLAYNVANNETVRKVASKIPFAGSAIMKNLDAVANTSFGTGGKGFRDTREAKVKAGTEMDKRMATDQRTGDVSVGILGARKTTRAIEKQVSMALPGGGRILQGASFGYIKPGPTVAGEIEKKTAKAVGAEKVKQGYRIVRKDGKWGYETTKAYESGAEDRKKEKERAIERLQIRYEAETSRKKDLEEELADHKSGTYGPSKPGEVEGILKNIGDTENRIKNIEKQLGVEEENKAEEKK